MVDPKFFNFVCQMAHMLLGSTITFGLTLLIGPHVLIYALPAFTLYTAFKEFWYDFKYEDLATSGGVAGSIEDFLFYQLGTYGALGALFLKGVL
jgi:hypothetical protein